MLLRCYVEVVTLLLELEECNQVIFHKLRSNWPADQGRHLLATDGNVLLNLNPVESIAPALGLNRYDIVRAAFVHAYVYFIRLHLANAGNGRP